MTSSDSKKEKIYRCDKECVKTSIDMCKLSRVQGNFLSKMLMENFYRSANFELRCPFRVTNSNLTITNFSVSDRFVPPFLPTQKFCLEFLVKTSLKGERKFVTAFQGKAFVRYGKD